MKNLWIKKKIFIKSEFDLERHSHSRKLSLSHGKGDLTSTATEIMIITIARETRNMMDGTQQLKKVRLLKSKKTSGCCTARWSTYASCTMQVG